LVENLFMLICQFYREGHLAVGSGRGAQGQGEEHQWREFGDSAWQWLS
jgi:hypothetical protein